MRLPYVNPESSTFSSEDNAAILSRVQARRAPRPLQPLDLTLLHSPNVADGWNSFLGAVRTKTSLADDVREIAICRVAVINEAWYEWGHHAPLAKAGGVSDEGIKVLGDKGLGGDAGKGVLSEKQMSVVRFTDEMTSNVKVPDEVFAELKKHFSEQEVVEITATVAAYNCVSRFLVALDVGEKNSTKGPKF
ncbi:AhpD-like protein [Halenospora varia]|nr:AhpD-like protein [Halenospora varia]